MNRDYRHSIGLSLHWDERARQSQYARCLASQFAIEIVHFTRPDLWNEHSQRRQCVSLLDRELRSVPLSRSLHGPFQDIVPHAQDRDVRQIAKDRVRETIEIGMRLGTNRFVFHTGINTVVTDPRYYDDAVDRQTKFWSELVEEFPDVLICLENMWEPSPSLHRRIIDGISSPQVKVCLDTGHVNVYSKTSLRQWVEELSPHLIHFHLHDNNGDVDTHLPAGKGTVRWAELFGPDQSFLEDAVFILELDTLAKQESSIEFMADRFGAWLFGPRRRSGTAP
jgi:sugar phosphate isomerase/epimerase